MLSAYRAVLSTPGVASVMLLGFLARIPFSALALLLTLHTVGPLGQKYLAAGLVVAASTLGTAVSAPWRGRLVDTRGLRRAVLPAVVVQSATLVVGAFVPYLALVVLAFVGGLFALPVFSVVRTSLSVLVPATQRRSVFALDAVATELVFMIGPAGITVLALAIGTRSSLVVLGALVALAGIGLLIANPPTRSDQVVLPTRLPAPLQSMEDGALAQAELLGDRRVAEDLATGAIPVVDPEGRAAVRRSLLSAGGIAVLVATAVANLIVTATDVSLVAMLSARDAIAAIGPVIAIWCAGSAIGGLTFGALRRPVSSLWVVGALGAVTLPLALADSVPLIGLAVFVAGLACAPSITATGEEISHRVPESARGEAMGWHGSALTLGGAIGAPVIGAVIDGAGASWGIAVAGALGVAIGTLGLLARRVRRRALRARWDAGTVGP